jgi:hypothetical protein
VLIGSWTGNVPAGAGPLLLTVFGSPAGFTVLFPKGYVTVVPLRKLTVSIPAALSAIAVDNPLESKRLRGFEFT